MAGSEIRVYSQYNCPSEIDYPGLQVTHGAFGILRGFVEERPAVCITQRNGLGNVAYRYLWNLPGGKVEKIDWGGPDRLAAYRLAVGRETWEELKIAECKVGPAIGPPLYLASRKDGVLLSVDSAQAFLVETAENPERGLESVAVNYCHQESFAGFNVVGRRADPGNLQFGRTPIMIFDGLSVLQEPFYVGQLTQELRENIIGDPAGTDFFLLDGGNYLARTVIGPETTLGTLVLNIEIYWRLNPDQADGRFSGKFDYLAG